MPNYGAHPLFPQKERGTGLPADLSVRNGMKAKARRRQGVSFDLATN